MSSYTRLTIGSLVVRGLLSIAFLGAGISKLLGVEMMVETFDAIGFGQGFRYLTGSIEIIGVILLWLPRMQALGAAILGGTMVGAVLTHWLILGPSSVPSIILGLLCTFVLYVHRDQAWKILGR